MLGKGGDNDGAAATAAILIRDSGRTAPPLLPWDMFHNRQSMGQYCDLSPESSGCRVEIGMRRKHSAQGDRTPPECGDRGGGAACASRKFGHRRGAFLGFAVPDHSDTYLGACTRPGQSGWARISVTRAALVRTSSSRVLDGLSTLHTLVAACAWAQTLLYYTESRSPQDQADCGRLF